LALLVVGGVALYAMTPAERARLDEALGTLVRRAISATKNPPESEPFNAFLRARTGRTVVTPLLIVLNVVVFILMLFDSGELRNPQTLIGWGANFAPRTTNGEWWRVLSAIFVHAGLIHLLVTTAALVPLGLILERAVGPVAFAAVYVAAGVLANVVSLWTTPALNVSSGGSGAMLGVYGLLLASVIWSIVNRPAVSIPLTTAKRIGAGAVVFLLYNVITDDLGSTSELTGFTVGTVAGLVVARGIARERPPARRAALVMAVSMAITVLTAVPVRGILDVRSEIASVIAIEERTAGAYDAAVARFRKGAISAKALAQMIEQSITPELQAAGARLKALRGVPREHARLVSAAEEYLVLREQSWRRRGDGLLDSNTAMLREADRMERTAMEAFQRVKSAG
jgi:rhomboid protease GluP